MFHVICKCQHHNPPHPLPRSKHSFSVLFILISKLVHLLHRSSFEAVLTKRRSQSWQPPALAVKCRQGFDGMQTEGREQRQERTWSLQPLSAFSKPKYLLGNEKWPLLFHGRRGRKEIRKNFVIRALMRSNK